MSIELVAAPNDAVRRAILAPLLAFNESVAGSSGFRTLAVVLRDDGGAIRGGLWGHTAYGWLYMQMLAVPETLRGRGHGRALVHEAEAEAVRRGCHHAWVDTIFGGRAFYERLGYVGFGELRDHPAGFTRSFLAKELAP